MKKLVLVFMCILIISPSTHPMASSTQGVATAANQLLQLLEYAKMLERMTLQLINQARMIKSRFELLHSLADVDWGNALESLTELNRIVQHGQALAYSMADISKSFEILFPGYLLPEKNYPELYKTWIDTVNDTLTATLLSGGFQAEQFVTEEMTMAQLRLLSDSAVGQLSAIQVGSMISAEIVGQLQKLRQIELQQVTSMTTVNAYNINKEAAAEAVQSEYFQLIPFREIGNRY